MDVFEDVSFVDSGVKRTGTVVAIEGSMLQVAGHNGEPPIWIDWRAVDVL